MSLVSTITDSVVVVRHAPSQVHTNEKPADVQRASVLQ